MLIKVPGGHDGTAMYSGSMIKQGEAYCRVNKTGLNTMIGEAAKEMQSGGPGKGVFQAAIERLVKYVILVTIGIVVIVILVQTLVRKESASEARACVCVGVESAENKGCCACIIVRAFGGG